MSGSLPSMATAPLTPEPCDSAPPTTPLPLTISSRAEIDLRAMLEAKNSIIEDLRQRLQDSEARAESLRAECVRLRARAPPPQQIMQLLRSAAEGGAMLQRCLAREAQLRQEWSAAAEKAQRNLGREVGSSAQVEEEALLHFECLAAKTSADLAQAQLRAECAQLKSEAAQWAENSEMCTELQACTEEELSVARSEVCRLRERLGHMAKARKTLKRRVQALSVEPKEVEQAQERCQQLCEEAAVALNINAEIEKRRLQLLQSPESPEEPEDAATLDLSIENQELREKLLTLESEMSGLRAEKDSELAETVLQLHGPEVAEALQLECENLRQQVAEAAATTPEKSLRHIEELEVELSFSREQCRELQLQVVEAVASPSQRIEELEALLAAQENTYREELEAGEKLCGQQEEELQKLREVGQRQSSLLEGAEEELFKLREEARQWQQERHRHSQELQRHKEEADRQSAICQDLQRLQEETDRQRAICQEDAQKARAEADRLRTESSEKLMTSLRNAEDLRRAQQEADRLREENAQQLTLATRQSEELQLLRQEAQQLRNECREQLALGAQHAKDLQKSREEAEQKRVTMEEEKHVLKEELGSTKEELRASKKDCESLTAKANDLQEELQNTRRKMAEELEALQSSNAQQAQEVRILQEELESSHLDRDQLKAHSDHRALLLSDQAEEVRRFKEELEITQAANAQSNEDAMRLQKELDQCRAEADWLQADRALAPPEEFQALRAETERLRAADVAATLLLSEKEEELQHLAEELGQSRHQVACLEDEMNRMAEEREEYRQEADQLLVADAIRAREEQARESEALRLSEERDAARKELDELKDNEVPRLVQEVQQSREDLRQLQETHDTTLTTHVTELQWWKSEVEKKAQIISQQVEEIIQCQDAVDHWKLEAQNAAATIGKQTQDGD
ncbi:unnamed protein product [Cladocopium goreaui]|uniref:Uncharacterized protein n=1 Tax=Cladocopium goreaui TaxID=2562237 RepID=A0A9P1G0N7_9DINO|nr:unnamed protein product [Cladocopium goreaui]